MSFLAAQLAEGFLAEATFVRFFSCVCHFMTFLVSQLDERFFAEATFVRF